MGRREENYLKWLERQIIPDHEHRTYTELYGLMFAKEFVWLIPNDDNRLQDGLDLRAEYFHGRGRLNHPCSVLEVLISLSRRIAFAAGGDPHRWAWILITNLELHRMWGHLGRVRAERVEDILHNLVWRTYGRDGVGGFFPLAWPQHDQRNVEIWYQMHAYIEELPEIN